MRRIAAAAVLLGLTASVARADPPQAGDPYYQRSQQRLEQLLAAPQRPDRARNVILFVGDGMGVSTVTAARIHEGQARGVDGESNILSFERLPNLALAKTYAHDAQVTDSAAGITGLMAGVKTANGVIGLDSRARLEDCASAKGATVASAAELAKAKGLSVGIVTTTRLTDATPAGAYGHSPSREWEDDTVLPSEAVTHGCKDLALQLAESLISGRTDVALGGGLSRFRSDTAGGRRGDGRDLVQEWLAAAGPRARFVTTGAELQAIVPGSADRLFGLFAPEHMPYHLARQTVGLDTPSLAQMTLAAMDVLDKNPKGYFLLVEGGLIDKGSHLNNAARTLTETEQFALAVQAVLDRADLSQTLVIVTADHSHGLVLSGGADRNAPILGLADSHGAHVPARDGKPYPILSFATGPAAEDGPRLDLSRADTQDPDFLQPALAPMDSAEHSGEDVAVYADGPGSGLVRGVVEQPYVFQVIRRALDLR